MTAKRMFAHVRRHMRAVAFAVVLTSLVALAPAVARPQEPGPSKETEDPRVSEARALVRLVYAAMRSGLAVDQQPFGWSNDFFKGSDGTVHIPFTLTIDQAKVGPSTATLYLLVTPRLGVSDRTGPRQTGLRTLEPEALQGPPQRPIAFEGVYSIDLAAAAGQGSESYRVRRAFALEAGEYEVYAALGSRSRVGAETSGLAEPVDAVDPIMIKQALSVPDLWTAGLATSTVVLVESVEPIEAPEPTDPPIVDPYVLGTTRIAPAADAEFQSTEPLAVSFWVYNTGLTPNRQPDVTVDYLLHRRHADGATFLGRTAPQEFNEQTQGGFDVDAGHELVFNQAIPLETLVPGAYRLEIHVNDNTNGASVTRHVEFTIRGS